MAATTLAALATLALVPVATPAAEREPPSSPRWMYEIKGGYFYPDLDDYEVFYGDDRDTFFSVSGAYRIRDWLETGLEIGYMRDRGAGLGSGGDPVPGAVEYELMPVRAYVGFILEAPGRRIVPYGDVGVGAAFYRQDIDLQAGSDGRTDAGATATIGVRGLIASRGSRAAPPRRTMFSRTYVFLEAQYLSAEIEDIDLGGTTFMLGFRFEFEPGR